jgi:hypothetical protein
VLNRAEGVFWSRSSVSQWPIRGWGGDHHSQGFDHRSRCGGCLQ